MNKLKEIQQKRKQIDNEYNKLKRSLAIQTMWPEVFKHGTVKCFFKGNIQKPEEMVLVIKNDKTEKIINLIKIPKIIFDHQISIQLKKENEVVLWNPVITYYNSKQIKRKTVTND